MVSQSILPYCDLEFAEAGADQKACVIVDEEKAKIRARQSFPSGAPSLGHSTDVTELSVADKRI